MFRHRHSWTWYAPTSSQYLVVSTGEHGGTREPPTGFSLNTDVGGTGSGMERTDPNRRLRGWACNGPDTKAGRVPEVRREMPSACRTNSRSLHQRAADGNCAEVGGNGFVRRENAARERCRLRLSEQICPYDDQEDYNHCHARERKGHLTSLLKTLHAPLRWVKIGSSCPGLSE
jgi:hypothetical protein